MLPASKSLISTKIKIEKPKYKTTMKYEKKIFSTREATYVLGSGCWNDREQQHELRVLCS